MRGDDALALVREWGAAAPHPVEVLACAPEDGRRALHALQVTTRSPLGAIAHHTGGLLVDRGWLRILGAGCDQLPRALDRWNGLDTDTRRFDRGLLVADDVLGGFFAWFDQPRSIHYFAPDNLEWEDLGFGYSDWLALVLSERLASFYGPLRWDGWEAEVASLRGDQALSVYPPLATRAEGPRSRRAVPVDELWRLHTALGRQLSG